MEKQKQSYMPSKKFIKFMSVIIFAGFLLWGSSRVFGGKETFKKSAEVDTPLLDEDNFYQRDSDSDGVYDWEEALWGLDPKSKDTNKDGVSDGDSVASEKRAIQEKNNFSSEDFSGSNLNQTEIFARQMFSAASLAKQQGGLGAESLDAFSKSVDKSLSEVKIEDPFALKDIKLEVVEPKIYKAELSAAFLKFAEVESEKNELESLYRFANGDVSAGAEIEARASAYNALVRDLLSIETPHNAAGIQLGLANNSAKLAIAFLNMGHLEDDPLLAVIGFSQYEEYSTDMEETMKSLARYFFKNGII